ncbi:MAG: Hint domain-containing protein [Myxococcota bacterium]
MNAVRSLGLTALAAIAFAGCDLWTCVEAGTPIATPAGERAVEDLEVGDLVLAWDLATRQAVPRRVTAIAEHVAWGVPVLATRSGARLGVTANHLVFDAAKGSFVAAGLLGPGTQLLHRRADHVQSSALERYEQAAWLPWPTRVYDLTLEGPERCYFAGGILVHNKSGLDPRPYLMFSLPDLSSALGDRPPLLLLYETAGKTPTLAVPTDVAAIVTWPELELVPTTAHSVPAAATEPAYLQLQPTTPLENRWYAMVVGRVPTGWTLAVDSVVDPLPDGTRAVRFRPDSHPTIRWLMVCNAPNYMRVEASVSEVLGATAIPFVITQDGETVECRLSEPDGPWLVIRVTCNKWDVARPVTIAMDPGLVGPTGLPVTNLGGTEPFATTLVTQPLEKPPVGCGFVPL